jgi:hypothetical protein
MARLVVPARVEYFPISSGKSDPSLDSERRFHPSDRGSHAMSVIALKVTRAPSTSGVHHAPDGVKPLFRGNGGTDYVCGNCAAVIASAMGPTQHVIVDQTICSACGAENEFPLELRA